MRQAGIVAAAGALRARPPRRAARRRPRARAAARRRAGGRRAARRPGAVETNFVADRRRRARPRRASRVARLADEGVGSSRRRGRACCGPSPTSASRTTTSSGRSSSSRRRWVSLSERLTASSRGSSARRRPSSGCRASARRSSAAARSSGRTRSASPTPRTERGGDARHPVPHRLDHEDVHGRRDHAAPRRGRSSSSTTRSGATSRGAHARRRRSGACSRTRRGCSASRRATMWETMVTRRPRGAARPARRRGAGAAARARHWHYSNLAFALLGSVVERPAACPTGRYVDERLLGPLGLARTTWTPEPTGGDGVPRRPVRRRGLARADARDGALGARRASCGARPATSRVGRVPRRSRSGVLAPASGGGDAHGPRDGRDRPLDARLGRGPVAHPAGRARLAGTRRRDARLPRRAAVSGRRRGSSVAVMNELGRACRPGRPGARAAGRRSSVAARAARGVAALPAAGDVVPLLGVWWSEGYSFTFSWRNGPARGPARREAGLAPAVGLRAGRARPVADGLGPRAGRVAARPARRGRQPSSA